jgi:hypothetical protein
MEGQRSRQMCTPGLSVSLPPHVPYAQCSRIVSVLNLSRQSLCWQILCRRMQQRTLRLLRCGEGANKMVSVEKCHLFVTVIFKSVDGADTGLARTGGL